MEIATHVSDVRLNDPATFRAFYADALPIVYSFLYHRVGGRRAIAEDLTQETFMSAVREIARKVDVQTPLPWVMGIAKHKLLDHYRREEREERRLALAFSAATEEAGVDLDPGATSDGDALEALGRIPATQRAALSLRYIDGLSAPEVAEALGRSVHAVESLLARGRVSFREALREVRRA
jgi:RNA polymerase sigma-70 factor (ECF subfamily)